MINTYLLTWNPAKWKFEDWPQALADMAEQGFYIRPWSCVNSHVQAGDRILFKKTGRGLTGIMASGTALGAGCPTLPAFLAGGWAFHLRKQKRCPSFCAFGAAITLFKKVVASAAEGPFVKTPTE